MFIQTEATPNPDVIKFIPGREVLAGGSLDLRTESEAEKSPLALSLFQIDGVSGVYFGHDFLTVRRDPEAGLIWAQIKAPILAAIMDFYTSGKPILNEAEAAKEETVYDGELGQIVAEIKELLETRVRPAVAQDGGDIEFDRFDVDSGTLWLHMRGACSGCPSSSATLKQGVESLMKHYVPEVKHVESVL
ncbi:NifU family protein [Asticcacaulis machinosus]|uniref:NifU family protein n=1 Tax=Asticcacaulis machinosus TaxID=2984211 RepID=A0ABT5HKJ9_9CAUL|nr:NifU family protein [Asticcacaulis machinosus]MDC7676770.1 NifU family protein [Asticcacaulis machinosus]